MATLTRISSARICDENGLSIIITHTNPQLILENTEKVIENHRIFGTNHVGIGMMPQKYTGSLEGMRAFLKDFGPAADKLHDAGMKLHYHNHGLNTRNLTASASSTHGGGDRPANGLLFWTFIGRSTVGASPQVQIEKMAGRIDVIHFKDMKMHGHEQRFAA